MEVFQSFVAEDTVAQQQAQQQAQQCSYIYQL